MPAEIIGQLFIQIVLELVVQVFGYFTSRILFPLVSFGYISVAPVKKGIKIKPRWHGFGSGSNGRIVIHEEMAALLGIFFWIVVAAIVFLF